MKWSVIKREIVLTVRFELTEVVTKKEWTCREISPLSTHSRPGSCRLSIKVVK